jgi:hypothetical protein
MNIEGETSELGIRNSVFIIITTHVKQGSSKFLLVKPLH